jgi:hypothetical protein
MIHFTKVQKITMVAMVGSGIFNPLVVAMFEDYFKMAYVGLFLICSGWLMGFLLYKTFKVEALKIPNKKNTKAKDGMKYEIQ